MWLTIMAQTDGVVRMLEKVPSIVTAASAGIGVLCAFDQNALAAWSAAIVCSGGVVANWLVGKYKEVREVRRQQDNADRAALVESIRDRIAAEIELASKVTQNSRELDGIKDKLSDWTVEADLKLKRILTKVKEYDELLDARIKACDNCGESKIVKEHEGKG